MCCSLLGRHHSAGHLLGQPILKGWSLSPAWLGDVAKELGSSGGVCGVERTKGRTAVLCAPQGPLFSPDPGHLLEHLQEALRGTQIQHCWLLRKRGVISSKKVLNNVVKRCAPSSPLDFKLCYCTCWDDKRNNHCQG